MSELSADELERLAAAATARPWSDELMHDYVIIVQSDDSGGPIAEFNGLPGKDCQASAAFIVYLANHATAIADTLRENERLKAELAEIVSIVRPADLGPPKSVAAEVREMFNQLGLAEERLRGQLTELQSQLAAKGEEVERKLLEWMKSEAPVTIAQIAAEARRIVEGEK